MQAINRELSTGEIISQGFHLFTSRFLRILIPLIFGATLTAILRLLFTYQLDPLQTQFSAFNLTQVASNTTLASKFVSVAVQYYFLSELEGWILWIVAAPFFGLAVMTLYAKSTSNASAIRESVRPWLRRLPALLISSTIIGLVVFGLLAIGLLGSLLFSFGLILLVIPALLLIILCIMFLPAIVLENASAISSIKRSRLLVTRRWRKVFVVALIGLILYILIGTFFSAIFSSLNAYSFAVVQSYYGLISDVVGVSLLVVLYQSLLNKDKIREESGEPLPSATPA